MKNKLLTILSIFCIVFMALGLTACDLGGGNQDPIKVTGVTLNQTSQTLEVGESFSLQATVNPSNADNKSVSWSSSNTSVASVSNGSVTALSKGTAIITVTTTDGNFTATCTVTVTEPQKPENPSDPEEHVHEYNEVVTEPTCTARGYTTYTCECGDSYVSNYVSKLEHEYNEVVTEPTCDNRGYTTYTCECGDTYVDNYVSKLNHSYGDWVTNGDGTHTKTCSNDETHIVTENCGGGTATCLEKAICSTCNGEYGDFAEHEYGEFVNNGDGTHTKTCSNDETHIVTENCSGGTATCFSKAICSTCNEEYGDFASHTLNDGWTITASHHYKTCTVIECGAIVNYEEHIKNDEDYCSTCGEFLGATEGVLYDYSLDGTYAEVIGYEGEETNVRIAETYDNLPVKSIYIEAFSDTNINSIFIPNSVTNIDKDSFKGCTSLTSVTIGNGVTSVGYGVFNNCTSLTSVTIGNGVTSVGYGAFNNCTALTRVDYAGTIDQWAQIKFADYYANPLYYAKNLHINGELVTEANITTATKISARAFYNCDSLTSVTIGNSVASIVDYAFYGCSSLTSVTIGNSVTNIGNYAFQYCSSLTSIEIHNSVTSIGSSAFSGCTSLTRVDYLGTIDEWAQIEFADYYANPLYYAKNLYINGELVTEANITTATEISDYAFAGANFTSVTIGNSVTSIGDGSFRNCDSLESITIPFVGASATASSGYAKVFGYIFGYTTSSSSSISGATYQYYLPGNNSPYYHYYIPTSLKTVVITGGTSIGDGAFRNCDSLTSIEIPNSVTSIGQYAFSGCSIENATIPTIAISCISGSSLKTVVITGGTSIGDDAFHGCSLLTSIEIPNSVTYIGEEAFKDCALLTSVEIPDSVTRIGSNPFDGCTSLVYNSKNNLKYLGNVNNPYMVLACVESTNYSTYRIDENCKIILGKVFKGCPRLNTILIPDSVINIGFGAFEGCSTLESITLPFVGATLNGTAYAHFGYIFGAISSSYNDDYVPTSLKTVVITGGTSIGSYAFNNCYSLESIEIPNSVTSIGNNAFYNCYSLTSIEIPNSVTSIGSYAFDGCTSLTYNVKGGLKYLGDEANPYLYLAGVESIDITSATIDDNCRFIGYNAFFNCSSLVSITLPFVGASATASSGYDQVFGYIFGYTTNSSGSAISGATYQYYSGSTYYHYYIPTSLKTVVITGGTSIGYNAFYNCTSLESIEIPNSVTSIGDWAFSYCSSLTSIEIPNSVTSIGERAFSGCSSLTSIEIPNSITSIGERAFSGCSSLTNIEIPNSVTSMANYAFYNCTSLTSVTIPNSVTSIGYDAFYNCTSLTSVYYLGSIEDWCNIGFASYSANPLCNGATLYINNELITELVIPNTVTKIKSFVFAGGNFTSIEIPNSVTSIGNYAFSSCTSLTSVTTGNSVTSIGRYAFYNCTSLESIILPFVGATLNGTENTHFGYIFGASSYSDNGSYVPTSLKTVVITGGTSIGSSAFYGCSSLESITLPFVGEKAGVTSSDTYQYPFGYIFGTSSYTGSYSAQQYYYGSSTSSTSYSTYYIPSSLKSVTITGGNILYGAFYNCRSLTSIEIPNSVTSICEYAFYNCSLLKSVYYLGSIEDWCNIDFVSSSANPLYNGATLYINKEPITELVIPNTVTEIKDYAFAGGNFTSIEIPSSVTSIGSSAFRGCTSLKSITLPFVGASATASNGYDQVFGYIFGYTTSSSSTAISGATYQYDIGSGTNRYYHYYIPTSLKTVVITGGASIGNYAFYNCRSLTSIEIPNSVTSIGDHAFSAFSSSESVYYLGSIEEWCNIDFGNIYSNPLYYGATLYINNEPITELVIPNTVTEIPVYAFYGQDTITSIEIPNSVTSIGDSAFRNCTSLTSIEIPNSVTIIGYYAFRGCTSLASIEIPNSVTSIGTGAFVDCSSLSSVTIPNSVTNIGVFAFSNCDSLASITFEDTSTWYNTTNLTNWQNKTGGTQTDVSNSTYNVNYFTSHYYYADYYWYKL